MAITIITLLILIASVATLLWGVISAAVLRFAHKLKGLSGKEWFQVLKAFIKEYSRKRLLLAFFAAEISLAGGIIPIVAKVWFVNSNFAFFVEISDQPAWLSLGIAMLIAVGFFIYLYFSDRKHPEKWDQIIDAALFVNNEFNFTPSKEWFEEQNETAIKALGKRYSPDINFPFNDIEWLLAALRLDDGFSELLWNELDDELECIKRYLRNKNQFVDETVNALCDEVSNSIYNLNKKVESYLKLRDKVTALYENLENYNIHKNEYNEFNFRDLREKTAQLDNSLSKIWIDFKASKYWIIAGEAGMGKSHLIGDIIMRRKKNGEPSVLLLGEQFVKEVDPVQQIKNKLEIHHRFSNMLQQFNLYGQRIGKPVVFFIDALNEGGGGQLWMKYWEEFIAKFDKFEYLRLVVSFRISGSRNWFYDLAIHTDKNHVYFHRGFSGNEQRASEFMFRSYGLDQPLWPSYGSEFANPLFLKTYCRLHEKSGEPLQLDNFWVIINKFCKQVNHDLSLKNNYSDALPLVTNAMHYVANLMVQQDNRLHLEYKKVNEGLIEVAALMKDPTEFMRIMIDEGLLRIVTYDGNDFVDFGYELIGDYFLANCLLEQDDIINEDKWWSLGEGVPEALAVIAPYRKNVEAFEIVEDSVKEDAINAMLISSDWRDSFTINGQKVIDGFSDNKEYGALLSIILERPFRSDDTANSTKLYDLLWPMKMSERDAIWTTLISTKWNLGRDVMNLAEWGMHASSHALFRVDSKAIYRCAETLIWSFTSTWRQLRDTATHAMVNILAERKELIQPLLEKYHAVNDPYVEERLWGSVMGALICCQDITVVQTTAKWVYTHVFNSKQVPENILVRDYAKGIIRYAQQIGVDLDVDETKLTLPFTDGTIPTVLTCKQITEKYDNDDWQNLKEDEMDVWRAKQAILGSMATEHSPRTNMYGDFGRYVFQSSMSDFPVDPEDMSNWAIEMIFEEYGYSPKVFSKFDVLHRSHDRSHSDIERIGKKYQWIAMYRILARLSDAYPDIDFDDSYFTPTQSARNLDPTYRIDTSVKDNRRSKYDVPKFDVTQTKNEINWLRQWKEMPAIEKYLLTKDEDDVEWVNLFSYNTIRSPKRFSNHDGWIREIWTFIQAFVVKKEYIKTICHEIHRVGLEGRIFRENREIEGIYAREFYWSDTYRERYREEYYGFAPFSIGHKEFSEIEIAPAYMQYNHSSSEDASNLDGTYIIMPNDWLYKGLGLCYGKQNGVWLDIQGRIVAMDNGEYGKGHSALLIRKDILLEFLNKKGLVMFWPVLTERQARMVHGVGGPGYEQNGGWAYMDEKGKLHHQFKSYVPSKLQEKVGKCKNKINKRSRKLRNKIVLFLSKHGLKKISAEEKLKILFENEEYSPNDFRFDNSFEEEKEES